MLFCSVYGRLLAVSLELSRWLPIHVIVVTRERVGDGRAILRLFVMYLVVLRTHNEEESAGKGRIENVGALLCHR